MTLFRKSRRARGKGKQLILMLYIYAVIKGEKALRAYCQKRWQEKTRFSGSFAHIRKGKDDCTIERIWEQSPNDNRYEEYFILYLPHEKGTMAIEDIRPKVYEDIRNGSISLLNHGKGRV